jgi:phospholipid/cholesterol/gamma-HCH transport system permease protein
MYSSPTDLGQPRIACARPHGTVPPVEAEPVRLTPTGELSEGAAHRLLRDIRRQPRGCPIELDCAALEADDTAEVARLLRVVEAGRAAGHPVRLARASDPLRAILAALDADLFEIASQRTRRPVLERIGREALKTRGTSRRIVELLRDTILGMLVPVGRHGIKWDRTVEQMALIGARGTPIVVFISFLVGVVLALNGATQLRQFGAAIYIANLVAISMAREMAPLVTAVIVAGRSGSAIAAEIGTMVVSEEIDAMRTMALSPVRFLVVPRIVALVCMMPLLTVLSNAAGIIGGYVIGVGALGLPGPGYVTQTIQALFIEDVLSGLVKSVVFALIIGFVGVYRGFAVRGGPAGVGLATTSAVVTSIFLCIVATAAITGLLYWAT